MGSGPWWSFLNNNKSISMRNFNFLKCFFFFLSVDRGTKKGSFYSNRDTLGERRKRITVGFPFLLLFFSPKQRKHFSSSFFLKNDYFFLPNPLGETQAKKKTPSCCAKHNEPFHKKNMCRYGPSRSSIHSSVFCNRLRLVFVSSLSSFLPFFSPSFFPSFSTLL